MGDNIPKGWKKYRFTDVADIISGGTPSKKIPEYWNGDIDWLTVNDFNQGRKYVYSASEKITKLGLEKSSTKILKKGQIIISARGTIGVIAVLGKGMAFNQSNYGINAKKDISFNDFIYYLLKYKINELKQASYGAVFDTITKSTFENLEIEIPESLEEQRAIALVLSSLDDKIDLLHRQNKTLEAIAETLFRKWFIEDAKEDWEEKPLGKVVTIKYGKNLPTSKLTRNGYPVFGGNGQIGFYSEYMYEKPQVLISCRGAASGKVVVSSHYSFITNNSLILELKKANNITFEFLKYYAFSTDFSNYISGSAQPQITIHDLSNATLVMPKKNEDLILQFTEIVRPIEVKIQANKQQIRTLEKLRDTLLPKLMSGEVRFKS